METANGIFIGGRSFGDVNVHAILERIGEVIKLEEVTILWRVC
jgi:hypothetical protein